MRRPLTASGLFGIVLELMLFAPRRRVATYADRPVVAPDVVPRDVY